MSSQLSHLDSDLQGPLYRDTSTPPHHGIPTEILQLIVRYLYAVDPFAIGRLSVCSKFWLPFPYSALDFVAIAPGEIPLRLLSSSSPSVLHISFAGLSESEQVILILSKLLSAANSVSIEVETSSPLPGLAGCLRKVQHLRVYNSFYIGHEPDFEEILFGSRIDRVESHPLRSLRCDTSLPRILAKHPERFSSLTYLEMSSPTQRRWGELKSLVALQSLKIVDDDLASALESLAESGITKTDYVKELKLVFESLPPQLASDLGKVCIVSDGGLTCYLDALPLFVSSTPQDLALALNSSCPTDPAAALQAVCGIQCRRSNESIRKLKIAELIKMGADPFVRLPIFRRGQRVQVTAFHVAVLLGSPVCVSTLYDSLDASVPGLVDRIRDSSNCTPLHYQPQSLESWETCYEWHRTNIPGWRIHSGQALDSPLYWLLKTLPVAHVHVAQILELVLKTQPDLFTLADKNTLAYLFVTEASRGNTVHSYYVSQESETKISRFVAPFVSKALLHDTSEYNLISYIEEKGFKASKSLAYLFVNLLDCFKIYINRVTPLQLAAALDEIFKYRRGALVTEAPRSFEKRIITQFLDVTTEAGIDPCLLSPIGSKTLVEMCIENGLFEQATTLLSQGATIFMTTAPIGSRRDVTKKFATAVFMESAVSPSADQLMTRLTQQLLAVDDICMTVSLLSQYATNIFNLWTTRKKKWSQRLSKVAELKPFLHLVKPPSRQLFWHPSFLPCVQKFSSLSHENHDIESLLMLLLSPLECDMPQSLVDQQGAICTSLISSIPSDEIESALPSLLVRLCWTLLKGSDSQCRLAASVLPQIIDKLLTLQHVDRDYMEIYLAPLVAALEKRSSDYSSDTLASLNQILRLPLQ